MNKTEKAQKLYELGSQAADIYLYDTAIKYLTQAADLGNADAMFSLGKIYEIGKYGHGAHLCKEDERLKFVEFVDDEKIFNCYKRAAEKGCKVAFIAVALLYLDEDNLEYNKRAADKWLKLAISWNQPAAEKGDPCAMLAIAGAYAQFNFNKTIIYGGLPGKDSLAEKWQKFAFTTFKKFADEGGDIEAMFELSRMFFFGTGTTKNIRESVRYLEILTQVDDEKIKARAYHELGRIFESSDATKSFHFYKEAAQLGDFTAMRILWYSYKNGKGVRKNLTEAERWLKKSEEIQAAFLATLPD